MQVTTAKLCCSDVFFWTFVRSPTIFRVSKDGALSHWAKSTVEFLQRTVPNFIEPSVWSPNSPDLNPVDYAVWGALQQSTYCIPISNLGVHKDRMRTCWESLDQQIINKSIDQWRDRLKAVVRVNGGHIEQLFWIRYLLNLLSCSAVYRKFMRSKNVCAFCHCVSSVTGVLWQNVNLTNNHLIFQNKIGVIFYENNWRLIRHIIQHMTLASSYSTTKNKRYGFYWPALYSKLNIF